MTHTQESFHPFQTSTELLNAMQGSDYKKLFLWTSSRLPATKASYFCFSIVFLFTMIPVVRDIEMWKWETILLHWKFFFFWLAVFPCLIICSSKYRYQLYKKALNRASDKMLTKEIFIVLDANGIHFKDHFISWKQYKIIDGKYGIALITFSSIIFLFPKSAISEENYAKLQIWIHDAKA